jgi:hypothetical protein
MKFLLFSTLFTLSLFARALSPNEMLVIIGAVKYYNQHCNGLNPKGFMHMNKGLKRFKMHRTPLEVLEAHPLAISGYKTAQEFGCAGTQLEAQKAGFGRYIY